MTPRILFSEGENSLKLQMVFWLLYQIWFCLKAPHSFFFCTSTYLMYSAFQLDAGVMNSLSRKLRAQATMEKATTGMAIL
ncbi:MAG: hypothetical protein BWZ01_02912 [Deltaproteobacteria bacterium ADurb.BinA179]|nr:MAG: hypothetical protein BWZ01_02912 [Deltaproteobacteria bacterium ADurb.BinA179]